MLTKELKFSCSLAEALDFEHEEDIIDGFINRYNITRSEAKEIFEETKKWLWLASETEKDNAQNLFIDTPLAIIDEMWHNFILYTKHYHKYCIEKFQKFIHHTPTSSKIKEENRISLENNPVEAIRKKREETHSQLSYIYDKLGAETVIKWYEEFPSKYNPDRLATIKK